MVHFKLFFAPYNPRINSDAPRPLLLVLLAWCQIANWKLT